MVGCYYDGSAMVEASSWGGSTGTGGLRNSARTVRKPASKRVGGATEAGVGSRLIAYAADSIGYVRKYRLSVGLQVLKGGLETV